MEKIADFSSRASDLEVLAQLEQALYRGDETLTPAIKQRILAAAAAQTAAGMREPIYYINQANAFVAMQQWLPKWSELPFETRMGLREMVMHIARYEKQFHSLDDEDQQAFLDAMEPEPRVLFLFSRRINADFANAIGRQLENDDEIKGVPTAEWVWNTVKRLDPGMEVALRQPLDPTQFVKRDLRKTPRRTA
jgi:hypothetical protein